MDNVLKGLLIAAGVVLTCIVIGLGFFLTKSGQDVAGGLTNQFSKTNASIREGGMTKYDGATVKGSEVINCIRKFQTQITIYVIRKDQNNAEKPAISFPGGSLSITNLPSDPKYINPNADFRGSITRNTNEAVSSITFKQVKGITDADGDGGNSGTGGGANNGDGGTSGDGGSSDSDAGGSNIDAQLSALITSIQEQQRTLATLMSSLTEMKTAIDSIQSSQGDNDEIIADLNSTVNSLVSSLEMLEGKIDSLEAYDDTALRASVDSLKEAIDSITTRLDSIDGNSSDLSSTISGIQADITGIYEKLEELAKNIGSGNSDQIASYIASIEQSGKQSYVYADKSIIEKINGNSLACKSKKASGVIFDAVCKYGLDVGKFFSEYLATQDWSGIHTISDLASNEALCKTVVKDTNLRYLFVNSYYFVNSVLKPKDSLIRAINVVLDGDSSLVSFIKETYSEASTGTLCGSDWNPSNPTFNFGGLAFCTKITGSYSSSSEFLFYLNSSRFYRFLPSEDNVFYLNGLAFSVEAGDSAIAVVTYHVINPKL